MVELLIASTISAVVITGLFGTLGSIYFSQKKINAVQSFASESRFVMERVAQLVRNNTIDYDRFFIEEGPNDALCANFDERQIPYGLRDSDNNTPSPVDIEGTYTNVGTTGKTNRTAIGYHNLFYWNIATGSIERYRNLGGRKLAAAVDTADEIDECAAAWHGIPDTLYLINRERTERIALRLDVTLDAESNPVNRLEMQRLIGVDTDANGKVDSWGFATWNTQCEVDIDGTDWPAMGDEKACARSHDWTAISPEAIEVLEFDFIPTPNRDPYLNYRNDEAQIQPQSFLRLHTKLRRPSDFGVRTEEDIDLIQQTMASSRVFGDPR